MNVRELRGGDAAAIGYPVLRELRPHVDEADFLEVMSEARGYRLFGAFEEGRCVAVMGCRVLVDFAHGKHLYVDDLVVSEAARSRGLGAKVLAFAEALAREEKCQSLRLCTGSENERAKSFYERQGWQRKAVAYKKRLN